MNRALKVQLDQMSHVMFGGLTHQPAAELAAKLVAITPEPLQSVFFSDSGSVAVEVAMKMAIQYWYSQGQPRRQHFLSLRSGYHGDTFGAMSVCDPVTGMHTLFSETLTQQYFLPQPKARFGEDALPEDLCALEQQLAEHGDQIAALILEPIVQGAGGMWFYSADYLKQARRLCDTYNVLLIADEIATGFGRSGKLFACEHPNISPDIMCVGKALTGGYLTLAATLTTDKVSRAISQGDPGVFMHGPTFMANPLACSAALASIELLLNSDWQNNIQRIATELERGLAPCRGLKQVKEVRILGAIGVVEMVQPVDMAQLPQQFVDRGVWVRPFNRLIYLMPPYIIDDNDLRQLTSAVAEVVRGIEG
jgi:adenosylmethionine---8-amino-7-oxononanoate aminotransferase